MDIESILPEETDGLALLTWESEGGMLVVDGVEEDPANK